jgi:hypothetical protein
MKKPTLVLQDRHIAGIFMTEILNGFLNLPGLNAGGTNPHAPYAAIVVDTNALQVGVPAPFGHIVCVALVMPDHGPLATNIAFS